MRRSAEFTRIFREGKSVTGHLLSARWIRPTGNVDSVNRVGVAAGKKLGGAVVRNRLKRRIREAYRKSKKELPCRGIEIVFVAKAAMIGCGHFEVGTEVTRLLREISRSSA